MSFPLRTIVSGLGLVLTIAGCGIRGPLTLPESNKPAPTNGSSNPPASSNSTAKPN